MRQQEDLLVAEQPGVDLRLVLVDVQADGGNGPVVEGGHEGGFVHDGATGGVDNDDARLHETELGGRDDVAGVGLGCVSVIPPVKARILKIREL